MVRPSEESRNLPALYTLVKSKIIDFLHFKPKESKLVTVTLIVIVLSTVCFEKVQKSCAK